MKYTYVYKTSDGVRHEAAMEAKSREEAFATLRLRGIRAIKVIAADGSKANGEVRGVRKRIVAAIVVPLMIALSIVAIASIRTIQSKNRLLEASQTPAFTSPRHQIYGDPAVVEEIDHGKVEAYLPERGDQMLAWFAQPGKICCPKGADPRRCADEFADAVGAGGNSQAFADRSLSVDASDAREVRELKQMVNGMREELRAYLVNGNGTARSFWRRLLERTRQENLIYERTKRELENVKDDALWEQKNDALRNLGLRTIPQPE